MKIGKLETKTNIFLAPMAGYTDVAFREQCKKFGAGLTTTEMVSAKGLLYDSEKTKQLLYVSPLEDIKSVQLFGHEPDVIYNAIQNKVLDDFDIIDLNFGCPAPKITKNGEGSFLMTNIPLAVEIVKSAVSASKRPVTVKMRLGFVSDNSVEFAKAMEEAGASMIAVHGRLKTQGYSGVPNYEAIKKIKQAVNIPVVANGNILSKEDAEKVLNITGADAVMIGRGAVGNPFIFADVLGLNLKYDKFLAIKEQFALLTKYYDEHYVVTTMRKQIVQYLKNTGISPEKKLEILQTETVAQVLQLLKNVF